MKFSIITATYNSADCIGDCLASVAAQSHRDIERIIIDGSSRDDTLALVKASGCTVDRLISEADRGIYDALNKGINLALGDVIGFVHSDDLLAAPDVIAAMDALFEETGVDGIYGDLVYVLRDAPDRVVRYWHSKPFTRNLLSRGWMPPHPTLYLRRHVYEKHGLFDESLKIAADYDFILRVMSDPSLRFTYLPKLVVKMRLGGASNKSAGNLVQKSREDLLALRRNGVGGLGALVCKNLSKLPQFFVK
jgi:glycosyltransferase involved in cell wall biosynthesis